eukprot:10972794-Alexandrium_andersonii.AAC.1
MPERSSSMSTIVFDALSGASFVSMWLTMQLQLGGALAYHSSMFSTEVKSRFPQSSRSSSLSASGRRG